MALPLGPMRCPQVRWPAARSGLLLSCAAGAGLLAATSRAADWTHYRGPTQNGVYSGPFRTNWVAEPPKLLWRTPMAPALSSLTISGGRAFTQARRGNGSGEDREFIVALDAATGKELWSADLDLADYPSGGVGDDDGPRSTPVIDGDRVYVFTSYMRLYCLEAASGKRVWMRDFPAELNSSVIAWQNAASPVIVGDLLYVNANTTPQSLTAVRKSDGVTVWRKLSEKMTQATPVAATIAGVPQVVFFAQSGLVAVKPDTGDLLWRFAFPYSTSTAASPVVDGDRVYCSAAYSSGSGAVRITMAAGATVPGTLWKIRSRNQNHWATGVAHNGYIYSLVESGSGVLTCISTEDGAEKWRVTVVGTEAAGYGSILKVNDQLLVLNESGEAVLVDANPQAYVQRAYFQAVRGKTWNSPAINDGILYARSTTEIAAWNLAPPAPPAAPLKVSPGLAVANGRAKVVVRTTDGSAISSTRAQKLSLISSGNPALPTGTWQEVPATPQVVGDTVELEDTAATVPARFYQAREKP